MSNTGRLDPITVLSHGEPFLFIIWIFAGARRNSDAIARSGKNGRPSKARVDDMGLAHVCSQDAVIDGGAYRDRTDDLMLAKQPLSQLS